MTLLRHLLALALLLAVGILWMQASMHTDQAINAQSTMDQGDLTATIDSFSPTLVLATDLRAPRHDPLWRSQAMLAAALAPTSIVPRFYLTTAPSPTSMNCMQRDSAAATSSVLTAMAPGPPTAYAALA
ncbi:MAG: hypothetical protein HYS43_00615 [Candidatus Liptonbacteria bacterium]|nr:hypothetical protein [Candidatus Liptonbacteria bacterium]